MLAGTPRSVGARLKPVADSVAELQGVAGCRNQTSATWWTGRRQKSPAVGRGFVFRVASTRRPGLLGYDVGRAGAFLALLDVEGYGLPFRQGLEAAALDRAVVDEDVFGAVRRCDEAKAFFVAEPLNCTCSHVGYLW